MSSVANAVAFIFGNVWVDYLGPDPEVPHEALMEFTEEAPYIEVLREEAMAYLRSFQPSKYVMDGAKVDWMGPTILGRRHGSHS